MISIETPVGLFVMELADDDTVVRTTFRLSQMPEQAQDESDHRYARLVKAYFAGDMQALDAIPRRQSVTPFLTDVYRAMSKIPVGQTLSYAALARAAGHERAVRAAGTACARNNLPLLVPCHRVVRSDNSIGNYAFGAHIKQWLLDHEAGARVAV